MSDEDNALRIGGNTDPDDKIAASDDDRRRSARIRDEQAALARAEQIAEAEAAAARALELEAAEAEAQAAAEADAAAAEAYAAARCEAKRGSGRCTALHTRRESGGDRRVCDNHYGIYKRATEKAALKAGGRRRRASLSPTAFDKAASKADRHEASVSPTASDARNELAILQAPLAELTLRLEATAGVSRDTESLKVKRHARGVGCMWVGGSLAHKLAGQIL